ncbi:cupin-like domain-containing protein [Erythrobacter sp. W53]|uniref:cupin-like domain-containing protein n=1 Tax=Erythrobacter sp. W53 TaxID=3425947 RepID=UPI003D768C79
MDIPNPLAEPAQIDRTSFERDFLEQGRPAVFRGLIKHWPLVEAAERSPEALADYLKGKYNGSPVESFVAPADQQGRHFYDPEMRGFNFERRQVALSEMLDKLLAMANGQDPSGDLALYAGSVPASSCLPDLAQHNPMPLLPPEIEPRIWIGNASRVAAHFDPDLNIACAISGTRRFILFPPEQVANLYIGPLEFNMAGPPASLVDFANPDHERFPRFAEAWEQRIEVELSPGDALFIPPLWWHHVEADGALNMLVNYWWGTHNQRQQMPALALAMLAIRERPLAERQAWRTLFDHYVFGEDAGDAAAHIPAHAQGVLGEANPQRDAIILSFIQQSIARR